MVELSFNINGYHFSHQGAPLLTRTLLVFIGYRSEAALFANVFVHTVLLSILPLFIFFAEPVAVVAEFHEVLRTVSHYRWLSGGDGFTAFRL